MSQEIDKNQKSLYEELDEWVEWDCPNCGETHSDPDAIQTHCRKCGTVVIVYIDGTAFDQGWKVPVQCKAELAKGGGEE